MLFATSFQPDRGMGTSPALTEVMKTKLLLAATLVGVATLSTHAGMRVGITVGVPIPPPPPPVVLAPPVVVAPVPDSYVWDGTEYVGVVGDQYYYLGPGSVWLAFGPDQFARFHGWEHGHPDWRGHAIQNTKYRGHEDRDRGGDRPMRHDDRDRDRH
jgi:hypothetical protein